LAKASGIAMVTPTTKSMLARRWSIRRRVRTTASAVFSPTTEDAVEEYPAPETASSGGCASCVTV
jgi:hypothetical protein